MLRMSALFASALSAAILTPNRCSSAEEPAYSPNSPMVKTWEPIDFDDFGANELAEEVLKATTHADKYQGYMGSNHFESDGTSVGDCDRTHWDMLAYRSGITVLHTHGNVGLVAAVYSLSESELFDDVNGGGWADKDSDGNEDPHMYVDWSFAESRYAAYVQSAWFSGNWKADHDSERSIVHIAACSSAAGGGGSVIQNAGGRVALGYSGEHGSYDSMTDARGLYNYLNGVYPTNDTGAYRRVSEALSYATMIELTAVGDSNTTLCPSVENPAEDNVHPIGEGAGPQGSGYVQFDTHCDTTRWEASEILSPETISGSVSVYYVEWAGDHRIEFEYSTDCIAGYEVRMRVNAERLRAQGDAFLKLDGGTVTEEGVAPNGDDFVWTFED